MADLVVMNSVVWVTFIVLALSKFPSVASNVAVCVIVMLLPLAVLAPSHWSGRISRRRYLHEAGMLVPGGAAYPLIAAANPDSATALVMGAASVYLFVAGRVWRRGTSVSRLWLGTTTSACGAAGVLADLPTPLGWHTLTYACFGAAAFVALTIARTPDAEEP